MKITIYVAIAFAMPVILWQIWRFVSPGLYKHERRYAWPFVLSAITLFIMGAALAYWTLPKALDWLSAVGGNNITQAYTADKYYQLIAYMMLAFGVCFEFPIILIFLQMAGIVSNEWLRKYRRHAIVVIFIIVAVATPSNDPDQPARAVVAVVRLLRDRDRDRPDSRPAQASRCRVLLRLMTAGAEFLASYEFELDEFQHRAVDALDAGQSVLVAAPTGSGKTVVAEYAVDLALQTGGKAFYTAPIKALSNQKFGDLTRRYGAEHVGLLTGDNSINGDAPVVVMTTEVLRNMIYASSDALDRLRYVVLDEVHYLQDAYRGPVWEEVILHLPQHVNLVCLSATVSNAEELADWITTVRGPTTAVIEERRPVDLVNLYCRRRPELSRPAPAAHARRRCAQLGGDAARRRVVARSGPARAAATTVLHAQAGRGRGAVVGRRARPRHLLHLQPRRVRRRGRRLRRAPGCG